MKIYLSAASLPEVLSLPAESRKEIVKRNLFKSFRHWQTVVAFLLSLVILLVGFWPLHNWLVSQQVNLIIRILVMGLFGLIAAVPFSQVHFGFLRYYLREDK